MVKNAVKNAFIIISCSTIIVDQLIKFFIKKAGAYSLNNGAIFGLLPGTNYFLAALALIFVAMVILYYEKLPKNKYAQISFALITGGLTANMMDRLFIGGVVDFIKLGWWPAFNIADSMVTMGIIGLVIYYFKK